MAGYKQWNNIRNHWHNKQKPLARFMRKHPTEAEQALWERLRRKQLGGLHFRRQHPIGPFIADFFCVAAQLAIEVDGGIHVEADHAEYDVMRAESLGESGVRLLRFTNDDVLRRMDWVLGRIEQAVREE